MNARVARLVAATVGGKRNDEFVQQHQRPGLNSFSTCHQMISTALNQC